MLPIRIKYTFNSTPTAWKDGNGWRSPVDEYLYYFEGTCQETGQTLHAFAGNGYDAGCPYLALEDPYDYFISDDGEVVCEDEYGQEVAHEGWQDGPAPIPDGVNIQRWEQDYGCRYGAHWAKVGELINPHETVYPSRAYA